MSVFVPEPFYASSLPPDPFGPLPDFAWMDAGLCRRRDPEPWFNVRKYRRAQAVCRACPVLAQCRAYAQQVTESGVRLAGVWGETTEVQRLRLAAEHRRQSHA